MTQYLDYDGLVVLWNAISTADTALDTKATTAGNTATANETALKNLLGVASVSAYTGDTLPTISQAIDTLNGAANVTGSVDNKVAAKIAEVVAEAPADFDTLKEIADWIANDTTGAAKMANDIQALQTAQAGIESIPIASIEALATPATPTP